METFIEILSGIALIALLVFLTFLGYYYFAVYRVHRTMSYTDLLERLRRNRTAYNRLNEVERNSKFGKQLFKSIVWCGARLKEMEKEKAVPRTTGSPVGNYSSPVIKSPEGNA